MKEKIKKYLFPGAGFVTSLLASLFWVALRINHSGISKFLGADTNPSFLVMNLPVMVYYMVLLLLLYDYLHKVLLIYSSFSHLP